MLTVVILSITDTSSLQSHSVAILPSLPESVNIGGFPAQPCLSSCSRSRSWSLSAIKAMNSEFVGLPLTPDTV